MSIDSQLPTHETVMDVTEEQVARVYAQAFMGATGNGATPMVDEIESFVQDVLVKLPQLDITLKSSLVSQEQKEQLLDRALKDRASEKVLNFLKVLARHDRLMLVRQISKILRKLDAERRGLTDVQVRVAKPIDDAVRGEIENHLRKMVGGEPVLHVMVDDSLIAGIVIRIGDRVFDGSVSTQLEHARRAMIDRATERIETAPERFMAAGA